MRKPVAADQALFLCVNDSIAKSVIRFKKLSWGMGWPFNPEPAHGTVPPQPTGIPRYFMMDADYGVSWRRSDRTAWSTLVSVQRLFRKCHRYFFFCFDLQEPVDKVCRSLPNSSHTYRREWSKVMIELNCSSYEAVFAWKNGTTHRYGI